MNRAQKRLRKKQIKREENKRQAQMKQQLLSRPDVIKFLEETVQTATEKQHEEFEKYSSAFLDIIMVITAYTLNYKLGLGRKRLPEIIEAIMSNLESFETGHLNTDDFYEIKKIVEKLGIYV